MYVVTFMPFIRESQSPPPPPPPPPPHAEGALSEVPRLLLAENGVETDNLPPRLSLSLRKSLSLVSRNSAFSERHYPLP